MRKALQTLLLTALTLTFQPFLPTAGFGQDNPFEEAYDKQEGDDGTENPFAEPAPSDDPENPFAQPSPTPAPPAEPDDPFAPAAPPPEADEPANPFAEPAPDNPFAATPVPAPPDNPFNEAPPSGNPFDNPPPLPGDTSNPFDAVTEEVDSPFGNTGTVAPADDPFANIPPAVAQRSSGSRRTPLGSDIRGLYVDASTGGMQTIEQVQTMMREFDAATFNRLYVEVRTPFGVAYNSRLESSLPFISPGFPSPIPEIRQKMPRGAELIAVITLLPAYNAAIGNRPPPTNPVGRFPGLINQTAEGREVAPDNRIYFDPGNPETTEYLKTFLREVDEEVRPDGYHFVGVKYPGQEWGYSPGAVAAFRAEVGGQGPPPNDDPTWNAWRRAQLTKLLAELRGGLPPDRQSVYFSVGIEGNERPPQSWADWQNSVAYDRHFADWLGWCREGVIDELVIEVHERLSPQGNVMADWVKFANTNLGSTLPVISISGRENFVDQFTMQYDMVRSRGVGTLLYQYAQPIRSKSRGFFGSLPNIVFRGRPGNPVPGIPLQGTPEARQFSTMPSPPPAMVIASAEPTPEVPILSPETLHFITPTPVPTRSPEAKFVPDQITRKVTLTSGQSVQALILEVSPSSIKMQPENSSPIIIARQVIKSIEPPL